MVLLEQGKPSQALAYLDKALELEPEHEQALLNSAILLQELGAADLRHLARQRLLKLLDKDGKGSFRNYRSTIYYSQIMSVKSCRRHGL